MCVFRVLRLLKIHANGKRQAFLKMGGRFVLSDDSHGVGHIGTNYSKAFEFIKKTGIQEVYVFGRGEDKDQDQGRLNKTVLHRVSLADLESHGFWQSNR